MNREHLSNAISMIDETMLADTDKRRRQRAKRSIAPRVIAAVAAMTVCGGTALAMTYGGNFRDIKNAFGTVTGTAYEQATDEIGVRACYSNGSIEVELDILYPEVAPYNCIDTLAVKQYRIIDDSGIALDIDAEATAGALINGNAVSILPASGLGSGTYTIEITALTAVKKADADLLIKGCWECFFIV